MTAATLATDQETIDTDRATVASARANLAEAVLTSPISGKVSVVTIAKGDSASGSSSSTSPAIRVVGSTQSKVTIGLTAAQVRVITTGMTATVTPDGSSQAVTGRVISIGLTATTSTSTSSSSTYPVEIALSAHATSLVSGADAGVTLKLAAARDVLTVPTSAVHRSGTSTYVQILKNGRLTHAKVTVGAVGAALTQIRSGLRLGERIVLANLKAAVPSSSTNLTTGRSGLSGGFGRGTTGGFGGGTGGFGGSMFTGGGGGFTGGAPGGGTGSGP